MPSTQNVESYEAHLISKHASKTFFVLLSSELEPEEPKGEAAKISTATL